MTATPLAGLRILELGQLVAGPFAGYMLGAFGAEIIKLEAPGQGDALRRWRKMHGDTSVWWYTLGRNKRSVTCNLRTAEGAQMVRDFVGKGIDVVIENFRPGRMEAWGLGYDDLAAIDERVIMVRISGYGQTGPKRTEPGFANVAEAFGGLRYTSGEPGRPPVRTGVSIGDSLAGLHAAYGTLAAVLERERSGRGQVVDVALYESVFNMMESLLPEFDLLGHVREPCGAAVEGIVPSGSYRCADGRYVAIGANNDSIFVRLMRAIGRDDLADDPELAHNDGRVPHAETLDAAIGAFTGTHAYDDVAAAMQRAEVPSGPILDAASIAADPHFAARGMHQPVTLPDGTVVKMPGVVPRLTRTPGAAATAGPALGEHTDEVLRDVLGYGDTKRERLRELGVI